MKHEMFLNACRTGKKSYQDKNHAEGGRNRTLLRGKKYIRIYRCPHCEMYHLTSSKRRDDHEE